MTTLANLRSRVISFIGEVDGTSVQTYSEPRVLEALKQVFLNLHRKVWWPQYTQWYTLTLDGSTGVHTSATFGDSDNVQDANDIRAVIISGQRRSLPVLPFGVNPYNLTGTTPRFWEALPSNHANYSRRFRVWPLASTGTLYVHARFRPATIDEDTDSQLDDNLLVFGAGWLILEQEDINTNATVLAERMFTETYADIQKAMSNQPIENPTSGYSTTEYLTDWSWS